MRMIALIAAGCVLATAASAQNATPAQMAALVAERSQNLVGQEISEGLRVIAIQAEGPMILRRDAVVDFELMETLTAAPEALEDILAPRYRAEICANPIVQVLVKGGVWYRQVIENAAGQELVSFEVKSCEEG